MVQDDLVSPHLCLLSVGPVSVPAKKRGGSYDRYYGEYGDPPYDAFQSINHLLTLTEFDCQMNY